MMDDDDEVERDEMDEEDEEDEEAEEQAGEDGPGENEVPKPITIEIDRPPVRFEGVVERGPLPYQPGEERRYP